MSLKCTMILGDCLDVMPTLPKHNASLCFADLPFGRTRNDWDVRLTLQHVWPCLKSACLPNAAFLFASTMPFSCEVVSSNKKEFRYDLIWTKTCATGFLNASRMPMRGHESILVFYSKLPVYNPQKTVAKCITSTPRRSPTRHKGNWRIKTDFTQERVTWFDSGLRMPTSVIHCSSVHKQSSLHPTQKPVALLDWLTLTYTNEGNIVIDPCSGSGTTAVSALQNCRHVTCIEKDPGYYEASLERVRKHIRDNNIDAVVDERR